MVRISRPKSTFRPLTSSNQGWVGIPQGSWVIQPESTPRAEALPGVIKPNVTNTGVTSSRARKVHMGDLTLTNPNQVYRDIDFYGKVHPSASGLKFYNCGFYGSTAWPTASTSLVDCRVGTEGSVTDIDPWLGVPYFEDCTFMPQRPSYYTDGIVGAYSLNRCKFLKNRVGAVINSTANSRPVRARVINSYFADLAYWRPLPGVATGTVNYGVDILAGGHVYVAGNLLQASAVLGDDRNFPDADGLSYPSGQMSARHPSFPDHMSQNGTHAPGAGLRVTQTRTLPLDNKMVIEKNWFAQGMAGAELAQGTYTFRDNLFKRDSMYLRTTGIRYYIRLMFTTTATIVGLGTNKFEDNGEILTAQNRGLQS